MPNFRFFAPLTQNADQSWSSCLSSGDEWKLTGEQWATNTGPIGVENAAGLKGVQKPGNNLQPQLYIAATEKIVADLAHFLQLPVPPVTIWDRGLGAGDPRFVAVSAWAQVGVLQWQQVMMTVTPEQQMALCPAASAMVPFETWIGAQDRQNGGNMLVAVDSSGAVQGYWIDYAFSLNHSWVGNKHHTCQVAPMYPSVGSVDDAVVRDVTAKIMALSDATITEIVNRIPEECLPRPIADIILDNLLGRRASLARVFNMGVAI